MNTYSVLTIADYIITTTNYTTSNFKLQRLLYYAQAASLVNRNLPLFNEHIIAYKYGPVIEEVYHTFKIFANDPISLTSNKLYGLRKKSKNEIIAQEDKELINKVIDSYIDYSPIEIALKAMNELPWKKEKLSLYKIIKNKTIKKYYLAHKEEIYGI